MIHLSNKLAEQKKDRDLEQNLEEIGKMLIGECNLSHGTKRKTFLTNLIITNSCEQVKKLLLKEKN